MVENVGYDSPNASHLTVYEAFIGSLGAVLAGALVGGTIGGLLVRRRPLAGAVVALVLAWPAAIVGFTVLPALLDQAMYLGNGGIDMSAPMFEAGSTFQVDATVVSYGESLRVGLGLFGVFLVVPVVAIVLLVRRGPMGPGARMAAFGAFALGFGAVNGFSVLASGLSYLVLAIGVGAWASILGDRR